MVQRRNIGYMLVATLVVALGCASLIGVEFSLVTGLFDSKLSASAQANALNAIAVPKSITSDGENAHDAAASQEQATELSRERTPESASTSGEESVAASKGKEQSEQEDFGDGATATKNLRSVDDDRENVTAGRNETTQSGSNWTVPAVAVGDSDEVEALDDVDIQDDEEAFGSDLEELMTPELIAQIESQETDCLAPIHVHLLWIGDVNRAPRERHKYSQMGYNLTVHTSADEILAGFHPAVTKAFHLAIPTVVGYDFLKFLMLYKYGGFSVDADTYPETRASHVKFPDDCDVLFGKEAQIRMWEKPTYRESGGNTYGLNRPFQILNWAMAVNKPRNPHIKYLIRAAMMHFFGRRDIDGNLIQDISGSGLMSDYVAMLHEQEGRDYVEVYRDETKYVPVQRMCLTDGYLHGKWIRHMFHGTWKSKHQKQ